MYDQKSSHLSSMSLLSGMKGVSRGVQDCVFWAMIPRIPWATCAWDFWLKYDVSCDPYNHQQHHNIYVGLHLIVTQKLQQQLAQYWEPGSMITYL